MATTASVYNASRTTRQVLKRHRKEAPSLVLHLFTNNFRFEKQVSVFLLSLCETRASADEASSRARARMSHSRAMGQ